MLPVRRTLVKGGVGGAPKRLHREIFKVTLWRVPQALPSEGPACF